MKRIIFAALLSGLTWWSCDDVVKPHYVRSPFDNDSTYTPEQYAQFAKDTLALRVILDANGLYTVSYQVARNNGYIVLENARIVELKFNFDQFQTIPDTIRALTALTKARFSNSKLSHIPDVVFSLPHLTELKVQNNALTTISEALGNATGLTTLYLNGNQLTSLPAAIGNLTKLTHLELYGNQLEQLPATITQIHPTTLSIAHNRLCDLSDTTITQWIDDHATDGGDWQTSQECSGQ
jgi:Leucine-rich repeat (LRR) protein